MFTPAAAARAGMEIVVQISTVVAGQGEDVTVAASSAAANRSCIVSGLSGGRWRTRHFTLVRIRPSEVSIAVSHGLCGGEIRRAGLVAYAVSSGGGHGRDGTAVAVAVAVLRLQVSLLLKFLSSIHFILTSDVAHSHWSYNNRCYWLSTLVPVEAAWGGDRLRRRNRKIRAACSGSWWHCLLACIR